MNKCPKLEDALFQVNGTKNVKAGKCAFYKKLCFLVKVLTRRVSSHFSY